MLNVKRRDKAESSQKLPRRNVFIMEFSLTLRHNLHWLIEGISSHQSSGLQSQMFYFYWFLSPHSTLTFLIVFPDRHVQIQEWMDGFWGSLLLIRFISANRHRLSGKLCVVSWYKIVIIFFEWQVSLSSVSNNLCGSITWTLKFFRKIAFILLLRNICVCLSLKSKKFLILYTKNVKTKSKICRIILIWHRLQVIRKEVALLIYNFYIQISLQHISLWNILSNLSIFEGDKGCLSNFLSLSNVDFIVQAK